MMKHTFLYCYLYWIKITKYNLKWMLDPFFDEHFGEIFFI